MRVVFYRECSLVYFWYWIKDIVDRSQVVKTNNQSCIEDEALMRISNRNLMNGLNDKLP